MRRLGTQILFGLAAASVTAASIAAAQGVPAELSFLAARAGLDRPVAAWCRAEFRAGRPSAFAVAIASASGGGGRYLVLESNAAVTELGAFTRRPDVSCYSRTEADQLSVSIQRSVTIQGQLAPRWNTTVVCAFVDETSANCWQFSPDDGVFVRVGGWTT